MIEPSSSGNLVDHYKVWNVKLAFSLLPHKSMYSHLTTICLTSCTHFIFITAVHLSNFTFSILSLLRTPSSPHLSLPLPLSFQASDFRTYNKSTSILGKTLHLTGPPVLTWSPHKISITSPAQIARHKSSQAFSLITDLPELLSSSHNAN